RWHGAVYPGAGRRAGHGVQPAGSGDSTGCRAGHGPRGCRAGLDSTASGDLTMLTFAHGWMFLLLPLPLPVRWLLPPFRTARPAVRLPFFQQLAELTGRQPEAGAAVQRRSAIQIIGYVVVWCALIVALARPQWLEPPIVRAVPTRDLLLAVDLSGSM